MGQYDSLNPDVIYFMHSTKTSKWHTHELLDFYAILFILSGQAEFQVGTDEFVGSAGQAIILKPGEERFVYSNDMHYVHWISSCRRARALTCLALSKFTTLIFICPILTN